VRDTILEKRVGACEERARWLELVLRAAGSESNNSTRPHGGQAKPSGGGGRRTSYLPVCHLPPPDSADFHLYSSSQGRLLSFRERNRLVFACSPLASTSPPRSRCAHHTRRDRSPPPSASRPAHRKKKISVACSPFALIPIEVTSLSLFLVFIPSPLFCSELGLGLGRGEVTSFALIPIEVTSLSLFLVFIPSPLFCSELGLGLGRGEVTSFSSGGRGDSIRGESQFGITDAGEGTIS
jgi:hypothetical protein